MELESKNAEISQYRESALDALLKTVKIIIPPLLIEREIQNLTDRRDEFIKKMNMNINDYLKYIGKTEEDVTKEILKHIIRAKLPSKKSIRDGACFYNTYLEEKTPQ